LTPKVLRAYKKLGYIIDLGSPARLYSTLIDDINKRTINSSGGFTVSDVFLFSNIGTLIDPKNVLVIGNSFGLSTFVLADLFPNAAVDTIDAELEDNEPQLGSEITRIIASNDFPNVKLTIGFSPEDLPKVANGKTYNFIFVDAMHTNEALVKDYLGLQNLVSDNCIIYFHDIANCNMFESWDLIKKHGCDNGFSSFEFGFTQMGCTALVKGYEKIEDYFKNAQNEFSGPYLNGYASENKYVKYKRPFFWDLSFSQIEQIIRRKIKHMYK
jgi:hypothetical protein